MHNQSVGGYTNLSDAPSTHVLGAGARWDAPREDGFVRPRMTDEPNAGVTSARTENEAPPAQETDDRPDDTVRITARMPRSLRDDVEYVVDAGRFTDMSEAVRYAIRDTFGDAREPVVVTDGGQVEQPSGSTICDLTGFQRDLLAILVSRTDADAETPGQRIKDDLEVRGYRDINHGRLYPNLDELAERGLIEKERAAYDNRTNSYRPSERGRELIEHYATTLASDVGLETEEIDDA
jgi:PadR family transcriptional regulator PadR